VLGKIAGFWPDPAEMEADPRGEAQWLGGAMEQLQDRAFANDQAKQKFVGDNVVGQTLGRGDSGAAAAGAGEPPRSPNWRRPPDERPRSLLSQLGFCGKGCSHEALFYHIKVFENTCIYYYLAILV